MTYTGLECALLFAGGLALTKLTATFLLSLWSALRTYVLPSLGLWWRMRKFGEWAVVTGATDGIGRAYAENLASQGVNIVLVSRNKDKLRAVAGEIEDAQHVKTKIIQADFSNQSQALYDGITAELEGLDIGILINNVGVNSDHPDYFLNISVEKIWQILTVNMASVTLMTHALLPRLLKQKRGAVINVSSFSGEYPMGLLAVYAASKAYEDSFTNALNDEYGGQGVIFQSVKPGFVATKMAAQFGIKRPTLGVPSAKCYVRDALRTVGWQSNTSGYCIHALQAWVASLFPKWLIKKAVFKSLTIMRQTALKKRSQ